MLDNAAPSSLHPLYAEFTRRTGITTMCEVRTGPRSVTWAIRADLAGHGGIPDRLIAGGVSDSHEQATAAIRRRYRCWVSTWPAGLTLGRAGW